MVSYEAWGVLQKHVYSATRLLHRSSTCWSHETVSYRRRELHVIQLRITNILSSSPAINKLRRSLPAVSVTTCHGLACNQSRIE